MERWTELKAVGIRLVMVGMLLALVMVVLPHRAVAQTIATDVPTDADTPAVARVHFESTNQLNALAAELDIWEVDHDDNSFVALLSTDEQRRLVDAGLKVTVLPDRTAEVNDAPVRAQWLRSAGAAGGVEEGIPGFSCYRTVEETYADLAELAAENPGLATWRDIGDSWDKETLNGAAGYDLNVLVLTNTSIAGPKPRLAVIAAIHAREYTTAELATRFAEHLVRQYGVDPDITWLLDYTEFHLIPIANPDGRKWAEQGYLWRKNTHDSMTCGFPEEPGLNTSEGVDLNRNSSFKWNGCTNYGCSSADACSIAYRGAAAVSEPETQVIEDYVRSLFPDRRCEDDMDAAPSNNEGLFISLHSYSELILFPWGWTNTLSPNRVALQTLGRKFGYYTSYQVCQVSDADCLYLADGTTDDWTYGELGVASYTFELGTSFFQSCSVFESEILDRGIDALTYAMKASRRPYETPAGPEVLSLTVSVAVTTSVTAPTTTPITLETSATLTPPQFVEAGTLLALAGVADDTRSASGGHGIEPSQPIAGARYTVDAPSWITGTVSYPMSVLGKGSSVSETITATVDTSGWEPGQHLLIVEAQDVYGHWGVPTAIAVQIEGVAADSQRFRSNMLKAPDGRAASNVASSSLDLLVGLPTRSYSQDPLECKLSEVPMNPLFFPVITN